MKRLALLLATSLLGTGCTSDKCNSVRVNWGNGFDGPFPLEIEQGCLFAGGVSYVTIFLDGVQVPGPVLVGGGAFNCGDGEEVITGVADGTHTLRVEGNKEEGYNSTPRILHRAETTFTASGCSEQKVAVIPGSGFVDLSYVFEQGGAPINPQVCAPNSGLWASVFDVVANGAPGSGFNNDNGGNPTQVCNEPDPGVLSIGLPAGTYTFRWMEERGPSPGFALEAADCTERTFTVVPRQITKLPVALATDAPAACAR